MLKRSRLLVILPPLCAVLIVLRLTVLRSPHENDIGLGLSVGILLGIAVVAVFMFVRKAA